MTKDDHREWTLALWHMHVNRDVDTVDRSNRNIIDTLTDLRQVIVELSQRQFIKILPQLNQILRVSLKNKLE